MPCKLTFLAELFPLTCVDQISMQRMYYLHYSPPRQDSGIQVAKVLVPDQSQVKAHCGPLAMQDHYPMLGRILRKYRRKGTKYLLAARGTINLNNI